MMKRLDTGRLQYEAFTDTNPVMPQLAKAAEQVRENRKPVASDNPFLAAQQAFSDQIVKSLNACRETTEKASGADVPRDLRIAGAAGRRRRRSRVRPATEAGKSLMHRELMEKRIAELKSQITKGGLIECCIRGLLYAGAPRGAVDERGCRGAASDSRDRSRIAAVRWRSSRRWCASSSSCCCWIRKPRSRQFRSLLPADVAERRKGLAAIRNVLSAAGEISGETAERLKKVVSLFGVNEAEPSGTGAESVPFVTGPDRAKAS